MKITNRIHTLKIPFQIPISPEKKLDRFVYLFIITGEKIYLIDTGVASAKDLIFNYIAEIGRNPEEITAIYLTHAHPDHIGAAKIIQDETGCDLFIHESEKEWIEDIDKQFSARPVPGFYELVSGSAKAGNLLVGENIFLEKNLSLSVFHTPGHSIGSVSYLINEEKTLITGDAIILPGELPIYENVADYLNSLNKLKAIKDVNRLLSSWDEPCQKGELEGVINKSAGYIRGIHKKVWEAYRAGDEKDPIGFCKKALAALQMPEILANPILAKSFLAHLKIKEI